MAKKTPLVRGNALIYQHDGQEQVLPVETPAWYAWLETVSTFAFTSDAGTFTARKERAGNQRGGWYWKAYRTRHGQHSSLYLGKSGTLTLARLRDVAQAFADVPVGASPGITAAAIPPTHRAPDGMWGRALPPLLATKLYRPVPRTHLVHRPHLTERLTRGVAGQLTLISAPAGFGKTTLLAQWLSERGTPAAWLSLDAGENDLIRFVTSLIAAVQTVAASFGEQAVGILQAPQPPSTEALLKTLLNDLATISEHFVLVLDDYHVLEAKPVDQALTYLVEHLPTQMHLVIATREDPQLPLARLRARGYLTELRAADLRFTSAEATEFLTQVMDLHLSADDIDALESRTEGWVAGLQLAALSMRGQVDARSFIASFTGSHRFVLDYLVEEVLERQPERIQAFLLRTSILERLCGPLCEAVLRSSAGSGQATLEYLDHANLFLVPLDTERRWYRYHHLFAELLRQRLQQSNASQGKEENSVARLHVRASVWYEEHGLYVEAFQHAAATQDVDRATRLIDRKRIPLQFRGTVRAIMDWLESLPAPMLEARPALLARYASLMLANGQTAGVEEKLRVAEAVLQSAELDDTTRDVVGEIASDRATLATIVLSQNQADTIIAQSRRALEYLHPRNLPFRTTAYWTLGFAYNLQGDRIAARQAYTQAIAMSQVSGNIFTAILATIGLGTVQEADNQLHLAAETYQRVLEWSGEQPLQLIYEAHLGLARIAYEWNDLEEASQHGHQSLHLARQYERGIDHILRCEVFLARLKLAQGDTAGAAALLTQANQTARRQQYESLLPEIAAAQVLTLLHQGHLAAAAHLAETYSLPLSQARVHLAQSNPSAALAVLAPWREQVEAKGWADEWLKGLVLQTLVLQAQGEQQQAVHLLCDALALVEPEGFIRTFLDEGVPMACLLSAAAAAGRMLDYISKLLAASDPGQLRNADASTLLPAQPLIEPLSRRELEVLGLIAKGHSNQEISEQLFLAVSTVKRHNRNIFGKLQVQRRTEAVAQARALGLL